MKIVLASTSALKLECCRNAFRAFKGADIVPVKVPSGVAEQPVGAETLTGAFNRLGAAKTAIPGADLYIAIENGLFEEGGLYLDRAVIVLEDKNKLPEATVSESFEFPESAVLETKKRGFDQWTVGQVMQEQGIVKRHDDPHSDLSGKSRSVYIEEALHAALAKMALRP